MFRNKEKQSLINARGCSLKIAENKASELKKKNLMANILITRIEMLTCKKGYGTIVDRFDAIKKLVAEYQSNN